MKLRQVVIGQQAQRFGAGIPVANKATNVDGCGNSWPSGFKSPGGSELPTTPAHDAGTHLN